MMFRCYAPTDVWPLCSYRRLAAMQLQTFGRYAATDVWPLCGYRRLAIMRLQTFGHYAATDVWPFCGYRRLAAMRLFSTILHVILQTLGHNAAIHANFVRNDTDIWLPCGYSRQGMKAYKIPNFEIAA